MRPRDTSYQARRRRRRLRTMTLLAVLALTAGTVWITVADQAANTDARVRCNAPDQLPGDAADGPGWQPLPYTALDHVAPAPASTVQVQVLNGSSQRDLATAVGIRLRELGFGLAGSPGNDPRYPHGDLRCVGQIRFGAAGAAAARTLSLVVPCTQLVRDNRSDATVDLALGADLSTVVPNAAAQRVLARLAAWSATHPAPTGGLQSAPALPHLDTGLMAAAHTTRC